MKRFGRSSGGLDFLLRIVLGIKLRVTPSEDRATLRSDPSAVLGPKSNRDGWKHFFQPLAFSDSLLSHSRDCSS